MPAVAERVEKKIVVAQGIASPGGCAAVADVVPFLQKVFPEAELFQKTPRVGRNAFPYAVGPVGSAFDQEYVGNAPGRQGQGRCASGRSAAEDGDAI